VDAHIVIRERKLDTLVKTRMDQFYLGEKTGSPDATHLPVKLALAILRDRKGVIDLELPVQGSLDDPDFKYGRIVWGAVVNVLTKIVTSPFSLLAKLAGGGADQDLSFAAFEPGSAVPGPEALAKAQSLAKALAERPDLSLEAEGTVDPNADVSALKKQALEAQLEKTAVAPGPDRRARALRRAFETAFPPAPPVKGQAPAPQPPPGEMEQRLLGTLPVTASDLAQLADARAKALLKLLEAAQIPAGRLFEVQGGPRAKQEGGSRVYFGLK